MVELLLQNQKIDINLKSLLKIEYSDDDDEDDWYNYIYANKCINENSSLNFAVETMNQKLYNYYYQK